jgi:hypothetical protein
VLRQVFVTTEPCKLGVKLENVQRIGCRIRLVIQRMYWQVQKPSFSGIKVKQSLHGPIQSLRGPRSDKVVCQPSAPSTFNLLLSEPELNPRQKWAGMMKNNGIAQ